MKQISMLRSAKINYDNKHVNGKIVSISSFFNHNTDNFFALELIKAIGRNRSSLDATLRRTETRIYFAPR